MNYLRTAALIALIVGAAGSLALMFRMGREQQSVLVIVLFVVWDAGPFALLGLAEVLATDWNPRLRTALHWIAILVSVGSLATYIADTLGPPHPQPAYLYVIVPPVSCLLAGLVLVTVGLLTPKRSVGV